MEHWHITARHALWAAAAVICVTLYLFHPVRPPAPVGPVAQPDSGAQTLARTLQGEIAVLRDLNAARGTVAVTESGLSHSPEVTQWLAALGRTPTVAVYSAQYKPPTPGPVPTLAPSSGLPGNFAQWHHADTVAATEEALKATPVDLHIDQQEIPPNRVGAIYLNDGAAGGVYAIARRKQLDLDLGVAKNGSGIEALAGYGYNIKHTDAGFFIGIGIGKTPGIAKPNVGLRAGLVVHP